MSDNALDFKFLDFNFSDEEDINFNPEIFDDAKTPTNFTRIKRFKRPKCAKYKNAQNLVKEIGDIDENEHINAIVSGDFISGDFIEAYLFDNNLIADEIIVSTLSMSSQNVDSLKNIQNYKLSGNMGLIISDYFFANERRKGVEDIVKNLGDGNFVLAVAGIHTKITLISTECGKKLVIGGSSNLRSSLNIEQITIDNCQILYAFHREWMAKILNDYQATHKLLRREKLWQLVQSQEAQKK